MINLENKNKKIEILKQEIERWELQEQEYLETAFIGNLAGIILFILGSLIPFLSFLTPKAVNGLWILSFSLFIAGILYLYLGLYYRHKAKSFEIERQYWQYKLEIEEE